MDPRNNLFGRGPRSSGPGYGQQAPPRPTGRGPIRLRQCKIADKTQEIRYIFGSLCAVSPNDFPRNPDGSSDVYIRLVEIVEISGRPRKVDVVVTARPLPGFPDGHISLSEPQRAWLQVGQADEVFGEPYDPFSRDKKVCLGAMDVEVGFARPNRIIEDPYDQDELADLMYNAFPNHIFQPGQRLLLDVRSIPLAIQVKTVTLMDLDSSQPGPGEAPTRSDPTARGLLTNMTSIGFFKTAASPLKLKGSSKRPAANAIIGPDFKFEDMGIGGLDAEFTTVFRRAFASRIFPPALIDKLGIIHVKGMLLYGPPGTGKTLIARQIGKMLNAREPKVINGPEVLNKYVGQSEENIRKLFADAEKEYKEKGDESGLHIIIFDELDAVCKQRGSGAGGGTGVGDSVVNQLLSKLDGVDQLNNILLIGMTNRRDMIDDALLRPGRLELQIEISLPDEPGRLQILNIHTAKMKKSNTLSDDVDLNSLAAQTKNFSGADISGLVRSATSFAFSHYIKPGTTASVSEDAINMKISMQDFLNAMSEVRPAFGSDDAELEDVLKFGIIHFSPYVERILGDGAQFVENVRSQKVIRLTSVLLHGPPGSGKTALAAHIVSSAALNAHFQIITDMKY
jgi:vesicle-fusing ATPase